MKHNIPKYLIEESEMIYGKARTAKTISNPKFKELTNNNAELALTAHLNKEITSTDLNIISLVGQLDYNDKRYSRGTVRLVANQYVREWVLANREGDFFKDFPKSNYSREDVHLATNYIISNYTKREYSEAMLNFIKALNVKID